MAPLELDVHAPLTTTPSNLTVIVWFGEKELPVTVTVAPTFPAVGETAIAGAVIVKLAVAAGPLPSLAVMLLEPKVEDGTVMEQLKPPPLSEVQGFGDGVIALPAKVNV